MAASAACWIGGITPELDPACRRYSLVPVTPHDKAVADEQRVEDASRARTLNAWRHMDVQAVEKAWRSGERSLGELLPKVWERLRLDQKLAESQLLLVWKQSIDPTVVAHAQPVGLVKGTLFVTVDSSAWLSEIVRYRRKEILDRLQTVVGRELVQRISFRVG